MILLGHGQTNQKGEPSKQHQSLLQADILLYADVKNTAHINYDKKKILKYMPNFGTTNIHAKKCFKDHYPDQEIGLATPNKYSSRISSLV